MEVSISHYLRAEKQPCLYTYSIYEKAASVFESLRHEPRTEDDINATLQRQRLVQKRNVTELLPLVFADDAERRLTYELVYSTLKYQHVIERLLSETSFFIRHPYLREVEPLVMVVMCDAQQRKFQPWLRNANDMVAEDARAVEIAIQSCRSKLNAALARARIDSCARSTDDLLPESLRRRACPTTTSQLVHAWINQLKTRKEDVISLLIQDGYEQVENDNDLNGKSFRIDATSDDVLAFPTNEMNGATANRLISEGLIVLQDYTSCLGPRLVRDMLTATNDVIHVDDSNGCSSAHLASLMRESGCTGNILRFSNCAFDSKHLNEIFVALRVTNVRIFHENLDSLDENDERLENVNAALVSAHCSKSAVANPVAFAMTEGCDLAIFRDLTTDEVKTAEAAERLIKNQLVLKRLLTMPAIRSVGYMTRSTDSAENEESVTKAVEYANGKNPRQAAFRTVPAFPQPCKISFGDAATDQNFKITPTALRNGCFLAALKREVDIPVKESPKDILARAAAMGLLGASARSTGVSPKLSAKAKHSPQGRRKVKASKSIVAFGTTVSTKRKGMAKS